MYSLIPLPTPFHFRHYSEPVEIRGPNKQKEREFQGQNESIILTLIMKFLLTFVLSVLKQLSSTSKSVICLRIAFNMFGILSLKPVMPIWLSLIHI